MSKIVFKLTDALAEQLKKSYGPVVTTEREVREIISPEDRIYCVGDRVSYEIIRYNLSPQAIFYDGLTERNEIGEETQHAIANYAAKPVTIRNPKGTITQELIDIIKMAETEKIKVFVEGEEDLATLALASHLREGTIIYGIPKKGMCIVKLDERLKKIAKRLFSEGCV